MKENLHVVIITVVLFAAGLLTGVWTQRVKPLPPPPVPFMGEFGGPPGPSGGPGRGMPTPEQAREMHERMEAARPQMEAFRAKLEAIETSFRAKLEGVLKPEQRERFAQVSPPPHGSPQDPRGGEGRMRPGPARGPGDPGFMGWVIYKPALGRLTSELGLDAKQQAQAEELFRQRRAELLNLVDTTPPPSVAPPPRGEGREPPGRD